MKINDIYESTTAGSIATVAAPMTTQKRNGVGKGIYGNEPKDSMFKGAKTKKPYANSKVNESKMKELAMDMRNMDNGNFQKKYKKSKEQLKYVLGDPDAVKEGYYSVRSNSLKQELENNGWERIPGREVPDYAKYGYRKNGVGRFYKVIDEPYHSFDVSFVKPRRVIDKLVPLDTLLQLIRGSSVTDDKKTVQEAHLEEDDLIIIPGQGRSRKTGLIPHGESRLDHEVEMARSDLFSAAKNAKQVYELIADVSEEEGLDGWVQEKIIKANDYLNTIREYLEGKQLQNEMTGGVIAGGGVGEEQVSELSSALLSRAATKAAFRQRDTAKALHDLENEPGTYFDPEMRGRPGDAHPARKFWSDKAEKFAGAASAKRDLDKEKAKSDAATSQMSPAQKRQFSGK